MEDPGLRRYRKILVSLFLTAGAIVAVVGGVLAWRGNGFLAFLALAILAYLVLLIRGYQADARERAEGPDPAREADSADRKER